MEAKNCYIIKNGVQVPVLPEVMAKMGLAPGQEISDERQFERIAGNNAAVQVAKQSPDQLTGRWSGNNFVLGSRPDNHSDRVREIKFVGATVTIKGGVPSGIFQTLRDALATAMTMPQEVLQQALNDPGDSDDDEEREPSASPHQPRPTPRI